MKIQKRHVLMASLVLALGAAVYLNWQFTGNSDMLSVDASKKLGEAQYVNGDITDETQEAGIFDSIFGGDDDKSTESAEETTEGEDTTAVKAELTEEQISYFSTVRTDREQTQSKVLEDAKEVLSLSENSEEAKEEAAESVSQLEKLILAQSNIENLLKAKGFTDVVCFISDEGCNVVVASQNMDDNSSLLVKDAVMSQLDMGSEQIKIIQI
ncbi:MAG TPA: SpoIIIAH-like family protein [Candidatus Limousia pullorum]|uniref:SpoIIIAH-like family protein n=1 Tax=Candidatus Limousia pullorum TaxID=2840860 RepID=A0A9D1LZC2_9FIRM|nr:SpoIIIAH-like family protein [Candidatus Limousia pullorum]